MLDYYAARAIAQDRRDAYLAIALLIAAHTITLALVLSK